VNDPLIARFAEACGATGPLDLRVDLAGGGLLAEGSLDQPFTLVGRDDACDVTLSDPEINLRHAWVQVLGGRAFAVDLGSRTGLQWPSGGRGSGWLDVGTPVRIGPFLFRLRSPASDKPSHYTPEYNPLAADTGAKSRPAAVLEFRNGRRAKDRWSVNRLLTLIGRASECKIHLTADDISPYHCGIVSTRTGLWVVDLSGRGVVVNGERMRVAPLPQSAELWVGRFLIGCQYQTPPAPLPGARTPAAGNGRGAAGRTTPTGTPGAPGESRGTATPVADPVAPAPAGRAEDEVELGAEPEIDGLPASHIMADVFRLWGPNTGGPMSNPILVSGSGPKTPPGPGAGAADDTLLGEDGSLAPLLRQMADLHSRSVAEFQQALSLVAQMFARVKREHLAVLLHEMNRIQELTVEISALQADVARQTLELGALDRAKQLTPDGGAKPGKAGTDAGPWASPSAKTPLPDQPITSHLVTDPIPPGFSMARAAERLAALQQDRAAHWQALLALVGGP
jgi:pSer/pThr/pTyr-binding forkhead associated (FHA) protein